MLSVNLAGSKLCNCILCNYYQRINYVTIRFSIQNLNLLLLIFEMNASLS
jgi:hypothetical protein